MVRCRCRDIVGAGGACETHRTSTEAIPFRLSAVSICICTIPLPLWLLESLFSSLFSPSLTVRSGAYVDGLLFCPRHVHENTRVETHERPTKFLDVGPHIRPRREILNMFCIFLASRVGGRLECLMMPHTGWRTTAAQRLGSVPGTRFSGNLPCQVVPRRDFPRPTFLTCWFECGWSSEHS